MTEQLVARINVQDVKIKAMESNTRHSVITPEEVSPKFNIGIKKAKGMLRVTTQKWIIHAVHPLHCRYRVDKMQVNRKRLNAQFILINYWPKLSLRKGTGENGFTLLDSSQWPINSHIVKK